MRLDDIRAYKHPAVGVTQVNKVLKQMQARNTWLEDLSESHLLNWRSFLANRPDAARIIGTGVVQFLVVRIPGSVDTNRTGAPQGYFAVMRWDGSVVRIHPALTGEQPHLIFGKPGRGLLDWVQPPTSADSSPPHSPVEPVQPRPVPSLKVAMTRETVLCVTNVDCISRRHARRVLDVLSMHMARQSLSIVDLTDGADFEWWRWLANLPDQALDMLFADLGIHSFWAKRIDESTCFDRCTCFVVVRADGVAFSLELSKDHTSITELHVRESPLYHKHGASSSKTGEGEPVGDSGGGLDPIGSSSAGRSSPPAPADHSCHSTCADNKHARPATPREWFISKAEGDLLGGGPRTNTRTLPANSCGVGSHGVDSPMDPSEPPMGSMDQPSTAPDASASQPSGVASAGQLPDPPRSGRFKVPVPPPPPTPEDFDASHASAPPAPARPRHAEQPPTHLPPVQVALQVPALGQPQLPPAQPQPPLAQPQPRHAELPPVPQAWQVQSPAPEQPWGTGGHAPLSQAHAPPMCQENAIGAQLLPLRHRPEHASQPHVAQERAEVHGRDPAAPYAIGTQLLPLRHRPEHASQPHVAPQPAELHTRYPAERPSQPPLGPPNQTQQQPLALEEQPVVHQLPQWTHMVPGGTVKAVGWPPGLAWPPGFSPYLAPPAPQQENHQQQSQPQGGANGARIAAPDQQPAHCNSSPTLVVQPESQSHIPSHQTRQSLRPQQSEGVDRWQEEVQPQTQWQEHQSAWEWADGYGYGYGDVDNNNSNAWQGNDSHGQRSEDKWERKARASDKVWSTVGW